MSNPLSETIFLLDAPYKNQYQGPGKKLLFVCTVGMLRSPTGALHYAKMGFNTRSCGADMSCALIKLSVNLILWSDKIIFCNPEDYAMALETFTSVDYDSDIKERAICLDLPDDFEYNDPMLIKHFDRQLFPKLKEIGYLS